MLSHNPIDKSMGSSFVVWGREDNCWHGFGGVFVVIRRSKLGACLILSYFCNERNEFCCSPPDFSLGHYPCLRKEVAGSLHTNLVSAYRQNESTGKTIIGRIQLKHSKSKLDKKVTTNSLRPLYLITSDNSSNYQNLVELR
jgi:hypothetical protein